MAPYIFDCSVNSGIVLLILYLGYRLFLYQNNNFAWSRGTLLIIYLLAIILPSIHFNSMPYPTATIENSGVEIGDLAVVKSPDSTLNTVISTLIPIYYIGILGVGLFILVGWIKIAGLILSGRRIHKDGYTLVISRNVGITPFSIGRLVVLPYIDMDNEAILIHELSHIRHFHFIDLCVAQIYLMYQWWNPAAWWMFSTLKTVHEYQADKDTISSGIVRSEYQTLIVTRCARHIYNPCADTLGSGNLKARLRMMGRRNSQSSLAIFLMIIPFAVLASAIPTLTYAKDCRTASEIKNLVESGQQENTTISYVSETETSEEGVPQYSLNVYFTGEKIVDLVKNKINYPYDKTNESGKVVVQFTLTEGGKTKNVNILKSSGVTALDEEAKRVVSELSMESHTTASIDGKDITQDIRFAIPITFNP